ncbi:hypothetical protein [Siminovitchia terrae]|uniref:hypothetical protein n=1 Tax=Siminovitchia terrae TaxID=1914933 RepID=UPI000E731368|nr:hypothetical protein [Siminovitchia terrae]
MREKRSFTTTLLTEFFIGFDNSYVETWMDIQGKYCVAFQHKLPNQKKEQKMRSKMEYKFLYEY